MKFRSKKANANKQQHSIYFETGLEDVIIEISFKHDRALSVVPKVLFIEVIEFSTSIFISTYQFPINQKKPNLAISSFKKGHIFKLEKG